MPTPSEHFTAREELHHEAAERIERDHRHGEWTDPPPWTPRECRAVRKCARRWAVNHAKLVRERFKEYGNISERICR